MSDLIAYIVNSLGWSAAGFLLGWLLSRGSQDVHEIKETVVDDNTNHAEHPPRRVGWLGPLVLVLALATVGQTAYAVVQQRQATECQADVNRQFIEAQKARSAAASTDRDALKLLATTIVNHPERAKAALEGYAETLNRTDEKRKQNPLPPLPEQTCD